jgi:KAP family P-loop domain
MMTSASSADPQWSRLTTSAKAAIRWAAAIAVARGSSPPDSLDLFAGIMLSHLRDSPPRQLLEHFGIPAGLVLGRDGVPLPRVDILRGAIGTFPTDQMPSVGREIERVLDVTVRMSPQESDGLVSLRMLFGALLSSSSAVTTALFAQLAAHGADPDAVLGSYPDFLSSRVSYAEFLRQRHPHRPPVVELPAVQPDLPRDRRAPADPTADPPDLVGIQAEVDAFAYLIASKRLTPPLAVGLFGEWGGGKSYFLRSVQRRIDGLISEKAALSRPPETLPFHSAIVQIEYNAWQYVEGDLWSSLLEHLFRNLAPLSGDTGDDLLAQRQRTVIEQLRQTGDRHDAARLERGQLEDRLRVAAAEVHKHRQEREVKLAELERRRREQQPRIQITEQLRNTIDDIVQKAGLTAAAAEAENLSTELRRAGETVRNASPVLAPLRNGGWRYLGAVVFLLALTPAVTLVLDRLDFSAVTATTGAVVTLLATAAGYVKLGNDFVAKQLDEIAAAQAELDAELTADRERLDAELADAQQALDAIDVELATAARKERELAAEAAALEVTLAETTPSRLLGEFISERLGSDDYRSRLGVPALVRRDLARMSTLIQQRHAAGNPTGEHGIDRIVLYIDDLDRCPTKLVVDVLQAVHLLLAFPLFVVVVAVDARWLSHSLREHYHQLQGSDAAPEDFIEKIFQVPFWVRPLDPEVRSRMITGLMSSCLATGDTAAETETPAQEATGPDIPDTDLSELRKVVASFGDTAGDDPPWLEAAALPISHQELTWMQRAAPLLGDTPRAVKRFANVYLLVRSVGRGHGWPAPTDGQIVILLAIATGLPQLATIMLPHIEQATSPPFSLHSAIPAAPDPEGTPDLAREWGTLKQWLHQHPDAASMDVSGLTGWVDIIRRFRFHR